MLEKVISKVTRQKMGGPRGKPRGRARAKSQPRMQRTAKGVFSGRMEKEKDGQEKARDHNGGNHVVHSERGARAGSTAERLKRLGSIERGWSM